MLYKIRHTEDQKSFIQLMFRVLEQIEEDPNFDFRVLDYYYGKHGDPEITVKIKWRREDHE